jgi:hypothetical protein
MPAQVPGSLTLLRFMALGFVLALLSFPMRGQRPPSQPTGPSSGAAAGAAAGSNPAFDLDIAVRDSHGVPLDTPAVVRLSSMVLNYNVISYT